VIQGERRDMGFKRVATIQLDSVPWGKKNESRRADGYEPIGGQEGEVSERAQ